MLLTIASTLLMITFDAMNDCRAAAHAASMLLMLALMLLTIASMLLMIATTFSMIGPDAVNDASRLPLS